jgi:dTDP-4-dehydrorhamnose reductase
LAGENFVRAKCSRHFVVRTCGLYGLTALHGAGKGNFVETMLRLGRERKQLRVVDDQRCTPTATADLADALVQLIETDAFGLYHATNSGSLTWCEFAREIFRLAKLEVEVTPITTAEFGAKAHRTVFSVLDCSQAGERHRWTAQQMARGPCEVSRQPRKVLLKGRSGLLASIVPREYSPA